MALKQNSGVAVRAGLVFQAVGLNEHLKVALRDAGVNVVVEIIANALSLNLIREANLDVFVVNLDPELEDSLEELTDMLDQMRRPVIFNDGAASSGLSGWDQARWARHLAAKITGELDATPPRPVDAKSIPTPVRVPPAAVLRPVAEAPPANVPSVPAVAVIEPVQVISTVVVANELPAGDVVDAGALDDLFAELDFDFDTESPPKAATPKFDDEESGLDGFDASAFDMPESSAPGFAEAPLSDLDELFRNNAQPDADGPNSFNAPSSATVAKAPQADPNLARAQDRVVTAEAAVVKPKADLSALNWSLEPLDGETVAPTPIGRAVYVAKEMPSSSVVSKPAAKPLAPATAPKQKDDSNELGDFDFFLESDALEVPTVAAPITVPPPTSAAITKRLPAILPPTAGDLT